jgi:H+/Cl- antiporter ClcA
VAVLQSSFFHVVDQPFVLPFKLDQHTPAVKYALFALVGIVGAVALYVYVVARRDPRIRSVQDVTRTGRFKPLGTAPVIGRPS